MNGRRLHRSATMALSLLMAVIGLAILVEAIAGGRAVLGVAGVLAWMTLLQPAQATPKIAQPGAPAPDITLPVVAVKRTGQQRVGPQIELRNY